MSAVTISGMKSFLHLHGKEVRAGLLANGAPKNLEGECIKATALLMERLVKTGLEVEERLGYCLYDDFDCCTNEPYSSHYYLIVSNGEDWWYLDATATQFSYALEEKPEEVVILKNKLPYWLSEEEPTEEVLKVLGY